METTKKIKYDVNNADFEGCLKILDNTVIVEDDNFLKQSEYRDKYNGKRLYNINAQGKVYVSKRAGDESDFWAGGKYCYDDVFGSCNCKTINRKKLYIKQLKERVINH